VLILGIDPGSRKTGWGLVKKQGRKIHYIGSGVIVFKGDDFMQRLSTVKSEIKKLLKETQPDEVSMESLIYVKSPTALIKLAQTRGVILGELFQKYENKIFEYSPNLVKSQTVGHGHASKEGVQKFLSMTLGVKEFKTDDESDALAIAMCHALAGGSLPSKSGKAGSLKASLAHKVS
tara:strand:+ start:12752 stop:13282 length:531 start_codon:yes stop_codon:yes gene_type:complete